MCIATTVNKTLAHAQPVGIAGRAGAFVRRAWQRFHDPALVGFGVLFVALVMLMALVGAAGCGGSTPPPVTTGSTSLAWSITDLNHSPATCAHVGARSVALRLRNRASGSVVATAFPCANSPGTAQIAPGLYDISFQLNAADGTRLATAPDQAGVAIVAGQVKRLTPIMFTASTQSGLVVSLAAPPTTANCRPTTAGGAGINGSTITLEFGTGGCAAVTFVRRVGTQQVGTYTVDCSSPAVVACIERNETLTTAVAAGTYVMHAVGKLGAIDCWQGDATLVVTPGKPLTQTLNLTHQNLLGC